MATEKSELPKRSSSFERQLSAQCCNRQRQEELRGASHADDTVLESCQNSVQRRRRKDHKRRGEVRCRVTKGRQVSVALSVNVEGGGGDGVLWPHDWTWKQVTIKMVCSASGWEDDRCMIHPLPGLCLFHCYYGCWVSTTCTNQFPSYFTVSDLLPH